MSSTTENNGITSTRLENNIESIIQYPPVNSYLGILFQIIAAATVKFQSFLLRQQQDNRTIIFVVVF
jgi:hypothetical protein